MASIYAFEIHNPNLPAGQTLVADVSGIATARRFTVRRNREEVVTMTFKLGAVTDLCQRLATSFRDLFAPGVHDLLVKRGNRYLLGTRINYLLPQVDSSGGTLELRATGFLDLFKDRSIGWDELILPNTDLGQAAWEFVQWDGVNAELNFGQTLGFRQTTRTADLQYQPLSMSIKDALISLTKLEDSGDFAFGFDKTFYWYAPGIGTDKTELSFTYPGNITRLAMPIDATELVNYSINRGSGNGGQQQVALVTDAASQAVYQRRDRVDDYPSKLEHEELAATGRETLAIFANPTTIPDVTLDGTMEPYLGSYWIGDRVRFAVDAGPVFAPLDGQVWRINEIDVALSEQDAETINLKVGYR